MFAWAPEKTVTPHQHREPATQQCLSLFHGGGQKYTTPSMIASVWEKREYKVTLAAHQKLIYVSYPSLFFFLFLKEGEETSCLVFLPSCKRAERLREKERHNPKRTFPSTRRDLLQLGWPSSALSPAFLRVWRWHGTVLLLNVLPLFISFNAVSGHLNLDIQNSIKCESYLLWTL